MSDQIEVTLSDGSIIRIEQLSTAVEREVSGGILQGKFSDIIPSIATLCRDFSSALHEAAPDKSTVQFGLKIQVESSGLTALIGKANADANFQITLEWTKK